MFCNNFRLYENLKMPKKRKRNTKKRAKKAKSFIEVPSRKTSTLEHAIQSIFKSLTNSVNQNYPEYVMLNKRKTFEKLNSKMVYKFKDIRNQGYNFDLIILILTIIRC